MAWRRLTLPMSPEVAMKHFLENLTSLEQKEILDFPQIWYLGLGAERKRGDAKGMPENSEETSSVYDDAKCIYIPVLRDHISYRYEILEKLGQGSFGLVLKCLDHKTKELVALKIIHNQKSASRMALRELEILDVVRKEDSENCYNVIHMKEHMNFRNHICIVFELQGMDLYRLIRNNNFHGFTLSQTHHYAAALVTSLQMLHRKKIIHCDLKPENILLSEKRHGNIKVADFGCSFYEHQKGYTYVQTRFYRAPEVILGLPFGTAIDMWSLGCILAELYTGNPLFSGTNEADQLSCIMEVLGMPPDDIIQMAPRRKVFFDSEGQPKNLTRKPANSRELTSVLKNVDLLFLDFMRRCLVYVLCLVCLITLKTNRCCECHCQVNRPLVLEPVPKHTDSVCLGPSRWDPSQRMTAEEAAQHQWLQKPMETL
ncbi:dual specificity tyrosine-phosphorylation-regulated kinase 4-like isoform X1 [Anguilla anguilla]|uniref:dual specificity tyrosine-phosphorylation-regulated kinase 4-like isoform X1 n=2 Tax=Anguilla anguilla TaxID=7936 RepID=UPI0015AC03D9|nr:dual specificity tyrosine-phosphorylation-regulated kinase 4-like isoform X1 [Anguilla anguilla]XP_035243288.1 dual specificity tyrosine-phosphorylation-regulated kinase 4-like isoform X1 [Anguilla anguilla]